jgi:phosphoglycerate dehydrogenase-like enzyme
MTNPLPFRVTVTADFYHLDNKLRYPDIGLSIFESAPHIEVRRFASHHHVIAPEQIGDAQGVIVLTPHVTRDSLAHSDKLLAIGRFGVGYDSVDVRACTEADVVVFITPGAVDRPVAEATVCWMLALTHQMTAKDHLVRTGQWDERSRYLGKELRDRTLGVIGLGGIGKALVQLLSGFGMKRPLVFDPYIQPDTAKEIGVELVPLATLLADADFVSIHCPLTERTRNLIGKRELALMKRDAYLINTARGGIVDEDALYHALSTEQIAGAAIDCFVGEPIITPHRFGDLENVLLAPHSIAHTYELFRDIGRAVCKGMLELSLGTKPSGVVNAEVFERESFQKKWRRLTQGG